MMSKCPDPFCYLAYFVRVVQSKFDEISKELLDATDGIVDVRATIPEFLTPQRTFEIFVKHS